MKWYNEPADWNETNNIITVNAEAGTDFWQITHYGFEQDNGHFYHEEMMGDFMATVTLKGSYKDLYDQAGLMVRTDEKNWIKTGIEFIDGKQYLSAVVTRGFSDWSVVPIDQNPVAVYLLFIRKDDYVEIKYSFDNKTFQLLRLAYFPPAEKVQVGVMCAVPKGNGFTVVFEDFKVVQLG